MTTKWRRILAVLVFGKAYRIARDSTLRLVK